MIERPLFGSSIILHLLRNVKPHQNEAVFPAPVVFIREAHVVYNKAVVDTRISSHLAIHVVHPPVGIVSTY